MISSVVALPARKEVIPFSFVWRRVCEVKVPLRISMSIRMTFLSVCAKLAARLLDTYVLPAPGPNELKVTTCMFFDLTRIKSMLVRIMRKASDTMSRPWARTAMPCAVSLFSVFPLDESLGISPRKGTVTASSMSLRLRIRVSKNRNNSRTMAGRAIPFMTPAMIMLRPLGEIGASPPPAGSSTRASVSVVAWLSAFSSRLFSR